MRFLLDSWRSRHTNGVTVPSPTVSDASAFIPVEGNMGRTDHSLAQERSNPEDISCSIQSRPEDTHPQAQSAHCHTDQFLPVIYQVNLKRARRLATRLRMQEAGLTPSIFRRRGAQSRQYSCKVKLAPLYGSFNVLIPIQFQDGVEWLLKLPANGCRGRWNERAARALQSEVLTMDLIYRKSSIPVPRVYGSASSLDNPLKVPYILMERIEGVPLYQGWHDSNSDPQSLAIFREKALSDVANAIVHLNQFAFGKCGALQYNNALQKLQVQKYSKVDHFDGYDLVSAEGNPITWSEHGPFINAEDYFLCSLNQEDASLLSYELQAQRKLLRLLVKWFFEATPGESQEFALTHPDFNKQNILVGEDGSLKGIIDWDGVVTAPHCIGCEEYPLFLTPDWNPHYWDYDPEEGRAIEENGPVMFPNELEHYRAVYAQKVAAALHENGYPNVSRTKVSGLARSLYIAANEPESLPYNVDMILAKIIDFSQQDDDTSTGTESDTTVVDVGCGLNDTYDLDGHLVSADVKLNLVEQRPSDYLPLPISKEDVATSSSPISDDDDGVGVLSDAQLLTASTELIPLSEPSSQITVEQAQPQESPDQYAQRSWPSQTPIRDAQPHQTLATPTATPTAICISSFLEIISYLVVYMGLLQSSDISPLAASAFLLLFSNNRLVATLVASLLGGLAFGGLILQISKVNGHLNNEPNAKSHPQTLSDARSLRSTEGTKDSFQCDQKSVSPVVQDHVTMDNGGLEDKGVEQESVQNIPVLKTEVSLPALGLGTVELLDCPASASAALTNEPPANQYYTASSEVFRVTMMVHDGTSYELADEVSESEDSDTESLDRGALREMALKKWAEDPLHDFGWYMPTCIYNALLKDNLDEVRTRKLKIGFQRLLASLDDKYATFDGLTLSSP